MNTDTNSYAQQRKSQEIFKLVLSLILLVGGLVAGFLSAFIESELGLPEKVIGIPALLVNLLGAYGLVQWILIGKEYVFPRKNTQ
ncbi:hypothetical protein J4N45_11080 [Vibrio sp. SCSIO 43140]|uniref:hypothetical protein n=1 Tax=Vibrio sp. SCSIO 43140 TaxID=2819100 RepID=UPI0020752CE8|nr:hypothetical protein [Vibrio sp. SCSIO 43140]USD59074.1 hypothetical protein J4N45_11080 [Vibrio sp. SCSIO 43140]